MRGPISVSAAVLIALACCGPEGERRKAEAPAEVAAESPGPRCSVRGIDEAERAAHEAAFEQLPRMAAVGLKHACEGALPSSYAYFFDSAGDNGEPDGSLLFAPDAGRTRLEDRACAQSQRVLADISAAPVAQRRQLLWDGCNLAKAGLVHSAEQLSPRATLMPYAMHALLLEHEVDAGVAREFGRRLIALEREALQLFALAPGQQLVTTKSGVPIGGLSPHLFVTSEGMRLGGSPIAYPNRGESVSAGAEDPAGDSSELDALLSALVEELRAVGGRPEQRLAPLVLVADARVPAQRLLELAHAAERAGFGQVGVAVQVEDGYAMIPLGPRERRDGASADLIAKPGDPPGPNEGIATRLHLHLSVDSFEMKIDEYPLEIIEDLTTTLGKVAKMMSPGSVVQVSMDEGVSTAALVQALALARGPACVGGYDAQCLFDAVTVVDASRFAARRQDLGLVPKAEPTLEEILGGRRPKVRQAKAKVTGALDKEIIRRVVRAHLGEVRRCYEASLRTSPELAGRVVVDFMIGPGGAVKFAKLTKNSLSERAPGKCIAKAVKRWRFPKPHGSSVIVSYPFVLSVG